MPTYSLLGPMNEQPYALGERPGGSDIPSIPLLTGRAAWDSISSRCDGRHMDTRLRPGVNHTIAPRLTDSPLDKKAAAEKMALGGGILRILKRLIPRSPGPLPPGKGINELLARQRTQIRGRPYKSTPAGTFVSSPGKPLFGKQDLPMLLGLPAIGAVGGAGAYGLQSYGDKRRAAVQATQPAPPATPAAGPVDSGSPGGEPPPVVSDAPDVLAKTKDFFQTHGTQLGVGAASGVGLYALYKILQNLTTSKEEKRQRAFEMLPKAAEADPGRFCEEFPKLAGFLCYCHNADLDDEQIAAGIEKAGDTIHEFDTELVKLAEGAWDWTKKNLIPTAGDVGALTKQELGGAARTVKGLGHAAAGGLGAAAYTQRGLSQGLYNQTLGRIPGAPQLPARESFDVAGQAAGQMGAGLKDVIGSRVSTLSPPGQDIKYSPRVLNEWARGPATGQTYAAQYLDRIRNQPGVSDPTRRLSQLSEGVGDTAATSVPFAATGGATGLGYPAIAADVVAGEGPWAEATKAIGAQGAESAQTRARAAAPQTLAGFSPEQQQLHELRRRQIVEEIQRNPNVSEGEKARAIENASAWTIDEIQAAEAAYQPFQNLELPDAGPVPGQNPNIPGAPGVPGAPGTPQEAAVMEPSGPPRPLGPAGSDAVLVDGVWESADGKSVWNWERYKVGWEKKEWGRPRPKPWESVQDKSRIIAQYPRDSMKPEVASVPEKPPVVPSMATGAPGAPSTTDSTAGLDQNKLNNLPPEQAQGAQQAAGQAAAAAQQDPETAKAALDELASDDPGTLADQKAQGNLTKQLGDPQTATEMYQQMDPGAKWLLWGGLAIGAIGLLSALADEEGGGLMSWIMTLLGVGGALGAAGHGGFLGQGAQQGIQGLMGQIGQATGKQQPPAAPSAATQTARQQIESAESPAEGLAASRRDGLTGEESAELLAKPEMREYLLSLPDEEALAVMNEAARNPAIADLLQRAATSRYASKVLTAPEGTQPFWLSPEQGRGWSGQHSDRFIEVAKQYAEQAKQRGQTG